MNWKDFQDWHLTNAEIAKALNTKISNVRVARNRHAPETRQTFNDWASFKDWHLSNTKIAELYKTSWANVQAARDRNAPETHKSNTVWGKSEKITTTIILSTEAHAHLEKEAKRLKKSISEIADSLILSQAK